MQYLIGLCFGIGIYMILADYFRVPYFVTSKAHNNLAHRQEKKTSSLDIWLGDLAVWLSRHIKLNEYKKIQLQTDLRSAGIDGIVQPYDQRYVFINHWDQDGRTFHEQRSESIIIRGAGHLFIIAFETAEFVQKCGFLFTCVFLSHFFLSCAFIVSQQK